jgi:hypothetical protein
MANDENVAPGTMENEAGLDPYDLAEPVDVLSKISSSLFDNLVNFILFSVHYFMTQASSKWKERKEALEDLLKMLDTPRLADGSYHSLISALAKVVSLLSFDTRTVFTLL